jgi:MFS family permease
MTESSPYGLSRLPTIADTPAATIEIPVSETSFPDLEKVLTHSDNVSLTASPRPATGIKWYLILLSLYTISFLYGLDNTIVADIQGAVVETYDEVEKLSWLGSGFPLGGVATILTLGKAYGTFNNKYMYLGTITIFEAGSAICGAAPTMDALIVGRVIAGVGAAGMYLGVLNLLSRFTTDRERPVYMGIIGLVWGAGTLAL